MLARLAFDRADVPRAAALMAESLALWRELGDKWSIAAALETTAPIVAAGHDAETAARLLGAASALRAAIAAPVNGCAAAELESLEDGLRAALGDATFVGAWEDGRRLSPDEAIAKALAGTGSLATQPA